MFFFHQDFLKLLNKKNVLLCVKQKVKKITKNAHIDYFNAIKIW